MFRNTILLLCASLLVLKVTTTQTSELESSKNDVKKAFESMIKAIDKALTQAQSSLDKAVQQVNSEASKVEEKAKSEVQKVTAPLQVKLNELVKKAADLGINVTKCQPYVNKFEAIPNNTVDGIVGCVTQQVVKAKKYCDDALANCKKIEADMKSIENEIDGCGGNAIKKIKCYGKLLKEIVEATGTAPQHIIEDVTKTMALVSQILPILEQCEVNQVKGVGTTAAKIIADFAICAGLPEM